jgi:hypothetical protein
VRVERKAPRVHTGGEKASKFQLLVDKHAFGLRLGPLSVFVPATEDNR